MSLTPESDIFIVLGIGVAVIVNTSTVSFIIFIFSLSLTPNLCSSSIIRRPKSLNFTSELSNLCVPIIMSTSPLDNFSIITFCSLEVLNLLMSSITIGKFFILSLNSFACCFASTVVGTIYATCFMSFTALNAARIATSVLPNPTSPQSNLSIGFSSSISFFISAVHLN